MDKKALFIRLSSLGDVVLASCVIDPLIDLGYRPTLLTFAPYGELFEEDPRLDVLQVKKEELFNVSVLEKLKDFDLYLDLHKNLKTLLLRLKLRGKWKSYNKQSIRRRLSVYFKSFRKPFSVVKAYLEPLGYKEGKPKILISEKRLKNWKDKLGEYICIAVGARYEKKRYPYFRELSELFLKAGYRVVLVGDQRDRELTEDWEGVINLCGELSLLDTASVIKGALLFVGNDSGLLHVARAVGTKAIQIYGGTHPTLGFALEKDEGVVLFKGLDCQPCDIHGRGRCKFKTYPCLQFDPNYLFETALSLLPS